MSVDQVPISTSVLAPFTPTAVHTSVLESPVSTPVPVCKIGTIAPQSPAAFCDTQSKPCSKITHLAVSTAANAFLFPFPLRATTKSFSAGKSLITRLKLARSRAFAGAVNSPFTGLGIVLWAGASLVLLFSVLRLLLYRFL